MKVVFIEPPVLAGGNPDKTPERLYGCSYELYHFPDLANLYCAAVLAEAGVETRIIDATLEGLPPEEFFARIEVTDGDFFVIHTVLLSKPTDIETIKRLRETHPDAKVIIHGPEATRVPEQYLLDESITVIRGEPEMAMREFIQGGRPGGLSYLEDGAVKHTPITDQLIDLDTLPMPVRDHPDITPFASKLFNPKFETGPFTSLMASRGCSFNCFFCVPNSISFAREMEYKKVFGKKPKVAVAGAEAVIREFESIASQGYKSVSVIDDQFLWNKKRTLDICEGVKGLGLEWGILSRADFLDDEKIVCALREAGCTSVDIGVESLSQKTLDYINKDLDVGSIEKAVKVCQGCGLEPKFNILFGASPTETTGDIRETVRDLRNIGVERVMFSIATPFKGTGFYDYCKDKGYLVDESDAIDPMNKSMISYPEPGMAKGVIESETKRAYRDFYLHPKTIWRKIRSIRSWEELKSNLKIAWRIF